MKKLLSMMLVLVLMMSLSVTAFAADSYTASPASATADVTAAYVAGNAGGTVFSVDVEWSPMDFTYQAAGMKQWDPETHTYSAATPASWSGTGTIKVTNHSNTALDVTPSYAAETAYSGVSMNFSETGTIWVASAADTNAAVVKEITVEPAGKMSKVDSATKIGTITVEIKESATVSLATAKALYADMLALDTKLGDQASEECGLRNATAVFNTVIIGFEGGSTSQATLNSGYSSALSAYNTALTYA